MGNVFRRTSSVVVADDFYEIEFEKRQCNNISRRRSKRRHGPKATTNGGSNTTGPLRFTESSSVIVTRQHPQQYPKSTTNIKTSPNPRRRFQVMNLGFLNRRKQYDRKVVKSLSVLNDSSVNSASSYCSSDDEQYDNDDEMVEFWDGPLFIQSPSIYNDNNHVMRRRNNAATRCLRKDVIHHPQRRSLNKNHTSVSSNCMHAMIESEYLQFGRQYGKSTSDSDDSYDDDDSDILHHSVV